MLEIERKFLVNEIPDLSKFKSFDIEQGYISYKPVIRIRKKDNEYFITKKSKGNLVREEIETNIDETTYNILKLLVKNNFIKKTRYLIPYKNLDIELDKYHGNLEGLHIVEIEFKNEKEASEFKAPKWVGKEVTFDKAYKNDYLSKK